MTKFEKKMIALVEQKKDFIFFFAITVLGVAIRFSAKDFVSYDVRDFLIPWYETISQNGGLLSLQNQVGNYGIPYQFLIAVMTYISVDSLYLYKILSCIFDFALAIFCACFISGLRQEKSSFSFALVYGTILVLPTVVLNSSVWAQCDSIYTFFVIAALYFLYGGKNCRAFVCIGIAFAFKLQTVFIIPFVIYYIIKEKKTSILWFGVSLLSFYIPQIPGFIMGRSFLEPLQIYMGQTNEYQEMWMNYPSFWVLVGNNYENLKLMALVLTISILGIGLFLTMHSQIRLVDPQVFMKLLIWSVWTCILFLPSMHERYSYLLDLLLIINIFVNKKAFLYAVPVFICSISTYGNTLFDNPVDLKFLAIVNTFAWFCYSCKNLCVLTNDTFQSNGAL